MRCRAARCFLILSSATDTETNNDTKTEQSAEHELSVAAWSRAGGRQECKLAADAVRSALDGAALTLTGHVLIDIRYLSAQYLRENDGQTFRAVVKFRAVKGTGMTDPHHFPLPP